MSGINQVASRGRELDSLDLPCLMSQIAEKAARLHAPNLHGPGQVAREQRSSIGGKRKASHERLMADQLFLDKTVGQTSQGDFPVLAA